jgi:hypothetical protein
MLSRAIMHGVMVALVVVLAVEMPSADERPTPEWLSELCADFDDFCSAPDPPRSGE